MSRKSARLTFAVVAASVSISTVGLGAPAWAWPFGSSKPADPAKTDPNAPRKATPEQRAAARQLDPLTRAAFWQHEVALDPSDVEAGVGLAGALRALGKFDEAADTADRVAMLAPKNEEAQLESARTHIAAGHGFYAIAPLKQAEALAPKDWRPVSLIGVALEQDERPEDAVDAYNRALKLSPNNPAVLSNLALFYATRSDTAQAEVLLRRAAAQATATPQVRQNLALVLGLEGKTAEAEHLMRQDLPPEAADANLAYFKAADRPTLAAPAQPAARTVTAPTPTRTWNSVQQSDAPPPAKGG
jgi:Flp pilus assembly protein TadD